MHLICEKAQNIEDWKDIILTILDKDPGMFERRNKQGDTPQ
jgi:hypothetical protein